MIEATVYYRPVWHSIKATLVMPTIEAAIARLQADNPIWKKWHKWEIKPTKKRRTPNGKIKFEIAGPDCRQSGDLV